MTFHVWLLETAADMRDVIHQRTLREALRPHEPFGPKRLESQGERILAPGCLFSPKT